MHKSDFTLLSSSLLLAIIGGSAALAGDVSTVAGTGGPGCFSGDGGLATAAVLSFPQGIAVAPDGTIYFVDICVPGATDPEQGRVRRIDTAGVITTIAGTGALGDSGDGGAATAATFMTLSSIALDASGTNLYIADIGGNRVRRVDLTSGLISAFAGSFDAFGFAGDGGAATNAALAIPDGVAVDSTGSVYIADVFNCLIRKVDITNTISTVAGDLGCGTFVQPSRIAVDSADNLFVLDVGANEVLRVDHLTNAVTSVAGGGATVPGDGAATDMNLGLTTDLAFDAAGQLYIANRTQVFKVDLGSGILSVFAGTGAEGFSGDGGPAIAATFSYILGLAILPTTGDLLVSDTFNNRVRAVASDGYSVPSDLLVDLATAQAFLNLMTEVQGSVILVNVAGRDFLILPNLGSVGLDVIVAGNNQLVVVDLSALGDLGGSLDISGNLAMTSLDLSTLTFVGGSLTLANDPSLSAVLISGVTSIGGNLTISGNQAANAINMGSLTTVGGGITINDNTSANPIDMGALTSAGGVSFSGNTAVEAIDMGSLVSSSGSMTLDGNTSATIIDMGSLTTVGGGLTISDNTSVTVIDMASLTTVSGGVNIFGNTSAGGVDLGTLTDVGGVIDIADNVSAGGIDVSGLVSAGGIDISGNDGATVIDISSTTTVGGNVTIVDNGAAAINMSSGTTVSGNVSIETTGSGTFDMGNGVISGGLSLTTDGYTQVGGITPGGDATFTATTLEAVMHLQIQAASFTAPVRFSVTHSDPAVLVPENGLAGNGGPAAIDPVVAYQFAFATPGLDRDATLSFDVLLGGLDAATQAGLLAAFSAGSVTLTTRADAVNPYQAFPVCGSGEAPAVGGCVTVEPLDVAGQPTTGTPAILRLTGLVGHFSTWAVAIASPFDATPPVIGAVPATVVAEATGPGGAAVSYAIPTATDETAGPVPVSCAPASGSIFPLGTTAVTCTASDAAGSTASASFDIVVQDTTAPDLSGVPSNLTVAATGPGGAAVSWPPATASDLVSGAVPVTCTPASGSSFPEGTTAVACSAADASGNTVTAGFAVAVQPPSGTTAQTLCAVLGEPVLPDLDRFAFQGNKGEKVTVTLAGNPAGTYTGGKALVTLLGPGLLKTDASALPNVVTATLPRAGTYYVSVSELLGRGRFTGAYCVTLESSLLAWRTFTRQ